MEELDCNTMQFEDGLNYEDDQYCDDEQQIIDWMDF